VNVAVAPQPEGGPAICMGMGDNSGYASPDAGLSWKTQAYLGGDNDCAFADPRQPSRVIVFAPRDSKGDEQGVGHGVIHLYVNPQGGAPDTAHGTPHLRAIPGAPPLASEILEALNSDDPAGEVKGLNAAWSVVSHFYNLGYRPLVMTPRGEAPAPDGDFVVIRFSDDGPELVRTLQMSTITTAEHWRTSKTSDGPGVPAFQQGPPLPDPAICIVQASGGHRTPVFYVGDQDTPEPRRGQQRLWKWTEGMAAWQQLVPSPTGAPSGQAPTKALRYYVDPYRPNLLYVVGLTHVHRSDNGGVTWVVDQSLERAVTNNSVFPFTSIYDGNPGQALIRDILFDPDRPGARFAVGPAGVFHTQNGVEWTHLILSEAMAMRPNNAAYDFASCPRALYVATSNRDLIRVSPLPPDWDYPLQTLQAAEGRITMLRVHDLGTAYGPPEDRIDAEVIIWLDTEPDKAFGLQLRDDANRPAAEGMLRLLRDSLNRGRRVRIDFSRSSCRTGRIIRVMER
jgi:hypothetical protein